MRESTNIEDIDTLKVVVTAQAVRIASLENEIKRLKRKKAVCRKKDKIAAHRAAHGVFG